jgi:hypothetical protein
MTSQVIPKKKGAVALWSYADEMHRRNDTSKEVS